MEDYKQETKVEERTLDVNNANLNTSNSSVTGESVSNVNSTDANRVVERKTQDTVTYDGSRSFFKIRKTIYLILGILEVLFVFRLLFKLLGANPGSGFVSFIYKLSDVFLAPFSGIFRSAVTSGLETKSVLEPATLIAMLVYAILVVGIIEIIKIIAVPKNQ